MTTPPMTPPLAGDSDSDIRVIMTRLEAKVDVVLAQHGAKLENHDNEIRELKARPVVTREEYQDHETRIRDLTLRPYVSPKVLAGVVFGIFGAIGAVAPFLDRLYT